MLLITLFWQMPDNNSLKIIMRQFMHHFGAVFCHFCSWQSLALLNQPLLSAFELIDTACIKTPLPCFVNLRQPLTKFYASFTNCFKNFPSPPMQCCKPITWLKAGFTHSSSTFLRKGRGEKHTIVKIAVFPIIFSTDSLENLRNFRSGILQLLILNQIECMHLPITSVLYKN